MINPALSPLMNHLVIGQHQKAPYFSAFDWLPHGSLVSIGKYFVTTREKDQIKLITESDQVDLITESDQAVRAMHSCNSWLQNKYSVTLKHVFIIQLCNWLVLVDCSVIWKNTK